MDGRSHSNVKAVNDMREVLSASNILELVELFAKALLCTGSKQTRFDPIVYGLYQLKGEEE